MPYFFLCKHQVFLCMCVCDSYHGDEDDPFTFFIGYAQLDVAIMRYPGLHFMQMPINSNAM